MTKPDKSIHNICIAAIIRSTMKPYEFKWTRFYEDGTELSRLFPGIEVDLAANELVICSTLIDGENFSVLTTQKLVTKEEGKLMQGRLTGARDKLYGEFKGNHKNDQFTFGTIQLENGNDLRYFIETGKASMVMIQGVRTRIGMNGSYGKNVEVVLG